MLGTEEADPLSTIVSCNYCIRCFSVGTDSHFTIFINYDHELLEAGIFCCIHKIYGAGINISFCTVQSKDITLFNNYYQILLFLQSFLKHQHEGHLHRTIQHFPHPRATRAACDVIPPRAVSIPSAARIPSTSSGLVSSRTRNDFFTLTEPCNSIFSVENNFSDCCSWSCRQTSYYCLYLFLSIRITDWVQELIELCGIDTQTTVFSSVSREAYP